VQGAAVQATGSGCRPSRKFLAASFDREGELGFDLVYPRPGESDLGEWVHNFETLVKKDNLRPDEQDPNRSVRCHEGCRGDENGAIATADDNLPTKKYRLQAQNEGNGKPGSGPKCLGVRHAPIIPVKPLEVYSMLFWLGFPL
jgi:hypothetical protein